MFKMNLSNIFGLLAGIIALIAYGFYFKQVVKGQSIPNPSSWAIWLLAGIINTFTYFSVVKGNLSQSFIAISVTFSVAVIFIYSLFKGKFSKISGIEIIIFLLSLGIGIFWQLTSNDRISNLLLQGIYVISYIPTISGIIKGTGKEYPVSWITAVIAYIFSIISILLNFQGDWIAIIFPLVNGIIVNGLIVLLIFHKQSKKSNISKTGILKNANN